MPQIYPFTAVVGQERMKRALVLNAVSPRIGGVLIRGERGTAKSTAARALAALLPPVHVVKNRCLLCSNQHPLLTCQSPPLKIELLAPWILKKPSKKGKDILSQAF